MSTEMTSPWRQVNNTFHRRVGIIEAVVFGVPDKRPTRFTWQLHVITGYFAAGSAATVLEAMEAAESKLEATINNINVAWAKQS